MRSSPSAHRSPPPAWGDWSAGATVSGSADAGRTASTVSGTSGTGLFTGDRLHEVVLDLDDATFQQALSTFQQSGEKTWLEVAVTLDGTTYERCGLRLKGNSTLRRADTGAGAEQYPWLVRLDKVVDGQNHHGAGLLHKAEATGDCTQRGTEPAANDLAQGSRPVLGGRTAVGRRLHAPEQVSSTVGGRAPGSALVVARLMATGRRAGSRSRPCCR